MCKELTIAKKEYKKASTESKQILEKIFGKDAFEYNWRDIDSFEKACEVNGVDPKEVLPYSKAKTPKQEWLNALAMMDEIVHAINPDFIPDYSNSSQYKWYAWFEYKPSNSGFRFGGSNFDERGYGLGRRLPALLRN
jgi:hypothetical protein